MKSKWTIRRKVLTTGLIFAVVSFALTMFWVSWELHEFNQGLRIYCDALKSKDFQRAYGLTSQEFRATVNFQTFLRAHNDLTLRLGDLKSIDIRESKAQERDDGWYGSAETDMIFSKGSLTVDFVLRKQDGTWKINSYQER